MVIFYDQLKYALAWSLAAVICTGSTLASGVQAGDTSLNQALLADTDSRQQMADLRRTDPEFRKAEAEAKAAQARAIRNAQAHTIGEQNSAPNFGK